MDNNLKKLLEKCQINKEYYPFFNDGKLLKIVGNKNKTKYSFKIQIPTNLPCNIYDDIYKAIVTEFSFCNKIVLESKEKNFCCPGR